MKFKIVKVMFIVFILFVSIVNGAQHDVNPNFDPYEVDSIRNANSATINAKIDDIAQAGNLQYVDVAKLNNENAHKYVNKLNADQKQKLNAQQLAYIKDGKATIDFVKANEVSKEARDEALKILGRTPNVDTETDEKPSTVTTNPNGFFIDYIRSINIDGIRVINAYEIDYSDNVLSIGKADTIIIKDGLLSDVTGFRGNIIEFKVKEVKNVVNKCVSMNNVKDSKFKVTDEIIEVSSDKDVSYNITDCSLTQSNFKSLSNNSEVKISKTPLPHYEIREGELLCYGKSTSDKIEANNQASVDYGVDCFTCLTVNPPGTYFYLDSDIRKDFNINVPKESSTYKLCLRKNQAQQFKDYNGLVDFVDKRIDLDGVVNYLRYPIKNNQILSLLSDFVYRGLKNVNALLIYDENLLFLKNVAIKNVLENKQQITITKPNNYYDIKEVELEDGKIHRIVELRVINKNQLNQDIDSNYESDSLGPKIKIINGVLVQDNGKISIIILPPQHKEINSFLK